MTLEEQLMAVYGHVPGGVTDLVDRIRLLEETNAACCA